MKEQGASRKALIFTESRRTQNYLRDFLEANGYTQPLTDWGAMLHDRWALPEFIWTDLEGVCREIQVDLGIEDRPR